MNAGPKARNSEPFLLHIRLAGGRRKRKKSSIRDDSPYHPRTPNKMEEDELIDFLPAGNSGVALGLHPAPGPRILMNSHDGMFRSLRRIRGSRGAPARRAAPAACELWENNNSGDCAEKGKNEIMNGIPNPGHLLPTSNSASRKRSRSLA